MSKPLLATFSAGVGELSGRDLAIYVGFGLLANGLLVAGFPKVGGVLAGMVLATFVAAIGDGATTA